MDEIHEYYEFILPLIFEAGKILKGVGDVKGEIKNEDWWDLITIYDQKIENIIVDKIKLTYPGHRHIGEEEVQKANDGVPELTDAPTWIIDPIDGTHNFVRKLPISCISVGLTINKEQVLGIVYNPYMDELYTAKKGMGAYLNGQRIYTSGCKDIRKSVMNYEMSIANRNEEFYNLYMFRFKHLIKVVQGFRSLGCILGSCYVACGRLDAYQIDGVYPWDAAAGTLIVKEAGGHVTDSSGKEFNVMEANFLVAATEELSDQYMEVERKADEERIKYEKFKRDFIP
ncbi:uncharacterized protein LOC126745413 [Anthonomus grandis grandis]|uniref:uncharacterized protein LOC126745413 n=1 Tax=Anthonomus grandis grandis TaxID=2921223 RepID=UPI00216552B1|nr:uncharacterized protein LOC126745413 [Anthonomus grandis grandis]